MKISEFRKVFDWMLNYQKENDTKITEWKITEKLLVFRDIKTNEVKRVKLETILV